MNYLIHPLLNPKEISSIKIDLEKCSEDWEDGKKTAGSHASIVKDNLQFNRESEISKKFSYLIKNSFKNC